MFSCVEPVLTCGIGCYLGQFGDVTERRELPAIGHEEVLRDVGGPVLLTVALGPVVEFLEVAGEVVSEEVFGLLAQCVVGKEINRVVAAACPGLQCAPERAVKQVAERPAG